MTAKILKDKTVDLRQCGSILVTCLVLAVLSVSTVASIRPDSSQRKATDESGLYQRSTKSAITDAIESNVMAVGTELTVGSLAPPFSPSTTY